MVVDIVPRSKLIIHGGLHVLVAIRTRASRQGSGVERSYVIVCVVRFISCYHALRVRYSIDSCTQAYTGPISFCLVLFADNLSSRSLNACSPRSPCPFRPRPVLGVVMAKKIAFGKVFPTSRSCRDLHRTSTSTASTLM